MIPIAQGVVLTHQQNGVEIPNHNVNNEYLLTRRGVANILKVSIGTVDNRAKAAAAFMDLHDFAVAYLDC